MTFQSKIVEVWRCRWDGFEYHSPIHLTIAECPKGHLMQRVREPNPVLQKEVQPT